MPTSGSGSGTPASAGSGTSLNDLILEVLQRTGDGFQSTTSSLASATDTLVDETLGDAGEPSTSYEGGHVKVIAGALVDQVRRVTSGGYDRSTGTLQMGRPYASAVASGVVYQFSEKLSFDLLAKCVNWALEQAYFTRTEVITPADTDQVTLPSWIVVREQLVDVQGRYGTTVDDYRYYAIHHVEIVEAAGTTPGQSPQSLKVTLTPRVPDADRIVVAGISPYPSLSAGTDTTGMPLEWLRAGAIHHYYDLLTARVGKEDASRYAALAKDWRGRWQTLSGYYQPNPPSRLQLSKPFDPMPAIGADPWWWAR